MALPPVAYDGADDEAVQLMGCKVARCFREIAGDAGRGGRGRLPFGPRRDDGGDGRVGRAFFATRIAAILCWSRRAAFLFLQAFEWRLPWASVQRA